MVGDTSEHEIHLNKRTDRIYLSKAFEQTFLKKDDVEGMKEINRSFRIVSKVVDNVEGHHFIKQGKELILNISEGQRHEIIAKFYEDTRGIFTLQIQKYTSETGVPHKQYFTLQNDSISKLYNFLRNISILPINGSQHQKFDDKFLQEIFLTKEQALDILARHPDLIQEILKNNLSKSDIIALGYKKEQLKIFFDLLHDISAFEEYKSKNKLLKNEAVWQHFFEKNTWIFGYGLNYLFNAPLAGKKLEQVVAGYNVFNAGKRIDALMQTRGIISSLCFGEIKTHLTPLLNAKAYRSECFSISDELAGGISQVQKTIQKSLKELRTKLELKDGNGNLTGESVFIYQPKAVLIIGCLDQFKNEYGVNEDSYSSFELFRKNIHNPEIVTFDELYERAKHIIEVTEFNSELDKT